MDGGVATERHIVSGGDMTTEHRAIGECHVVADMAIVPDMRAHHEKAAGADLGDPAAILGSDVHRDAFANIAVGTDDEPRRTAAIFHRLRRRSEGCERRDRRARADRGMAGEIDMGEQAAAFADHHVRADDAIGADVHVGRDLGTAIDHGSRMNARHHAYSSAIMAPSSASATNWPPTLASPRNHHIMRRLDILLIGYSTTSPGMTGRRNLALSMVRKNTRAAGPLRPCARPQIAPAVCAMPSSRSTPGITGLPGKCP